MNEPTTTDIRTGAHQAVPFRPAADPSCLMGPSFTEALVDPAGAFREPSNVLEHPWLTREEKRTILLSWARDELVLEQVANRAMPELRPKSRIDAVIDVLSQLDAPAAAEYCTAVAAIRAQHLRRASHAARFNGSAESGNIWREASCRNA